MQKCCFIFLCNTLGLGYAMQGEVNLFFFSCSVAESMLCACFYFLGYIVDLKTRDSFLHSKCFFGNTY